MKVDDVGRWRFCPACGRPLMSPVFAIEDQDSAEFDYEAIRCSCCERPWIACPCAPAGEGECLSVTPNAESKLSDAVERRIKDAFWGTFHKGGEFWFDYLGDEDECEESTNDKWLEFMRNLRSNG